MRCNVKIGIALPPIKVLIILQEDDLLCKTFGLFFVSSAVRAHSKIRLEPLKNSNTVLPAELSRLGRPFLTKVIDGLPQPVFQRHAGLPAKKALRLPNIRFPLLGIILRQRLINNLGLGFR